MAKFSNVNVTVLTVLV